jgi:hypothetical protein
MDRAAGQRCMTRLMSFVAFLCLSVAGGLRAEPVNTFGIGGATCAHFAEKYRQSPALAEFAFFTWSQGYLTSVNTQRQILHLPLIDLSPPKFGIEEEKAFLRDFCDKNPLKFFMVGVEVLLDQLSKQQRIH